LGLGRLPVEAILGHKDAVGANGALYRRRPQVLLDEVPLPILLGGHRDTR